MAISAAQLEDSALVHTHTKVYSQYMQVNRKSRQSQVTQLRHVLYSWEDNAQWLPSRRDSGALSSSFEYCLMLQTATSQQSSKRTALLFTVFYPYPEDSHSHFTAHESSPNAQRNGITRNDIIEIPRNNSFTMFLRG